MFSVEKFIPYKNTDSKSNIRSLLSALNAVSPVCDFFGVSGLHLYEINSIPMDSQNLITLVIAVCAFLAALYSFYLVNDLRKKNASKPGTDNFTSRPLQLQAYERLVMLAERISIPNLVSRANQTTQGNQAGLNARQMQLLLLDSVKQEYEYNTTQQIYVSPVAWEAVKNLKDQNMLIINQVGATLPPEATGLDMNRRLLEFTMNSKKGVLHEIVMEALNYEAKKLMR
jgi:hypothetical protein